MRQIFINVSDELDCDFEDDLAIYKRHPQCLEKCKQELVTVSLSFHSCFHLLTKTLALLQF